MSEEEVIQKNHDTSTIETQINHNNKKKDVDPELFSCLLQPVNADADPEYIGIRRLLLYRKAESGDLRRLDWRCNGKGYASYRNYIRRPRNWESQQMASLQSTPGDRVIYWLMDQWAMASMSKSTVPFI